MKRRDRIKAKFGGSCAYCGEPLGDKWHIDHMEPVVRDFVFTGSGTKQTGKCEHPDRKNEANEVPACIPCNMNKSSLPLERWREQIASRLEALRKYSADYRTALRFNFVTENDIAVIFHFEAWESMQRGQP